MDPKLEIILFVCFLLLSFLGAFWAFRTERRLKKIFLGKKGKDLEETILFLQEEISKLETAKQNIEREIKTLQAKARKSIQGLETLRFNPFPDQGGNQSFAIGFLNEENDGVVLSSLYSRERMSIFAKPIKAGKSEYELTAEEKKVLERAKL